MTSIFTRSPHSTIASMALAFALGTASFSSFAQNEPSLQQVFQAVQAGQLDKAQGMMQQVLAAHPNSAKAQYVQAEIDAKQGKLAAAREALAKAEKLAPGLPFAKAESVAQLKKQLSGTAVATTAAASNSGTLNGAPLPGNSGSVVTAPASTTRPAVTNTTSAPAAASSFPWGMALGLGGLGLLAVFLLKRRRAGSDAQSFTPNNMQQNGYPNGAAPMNPNNGFGNNPGMAPGYGQQPAGSGLGGKVAGGLATGLAVGAGMMAAQAIGRTLSGDQQHGNAASPNANNGNGFEPLPNQPIDNNFGVNDSSSWDDNSSSSGVDSGGGWDSE